MTRDVVTAERGSGLRAAGLPQNPIATSTVLVITPRADLRQALAQQLRSLRWSVQEAASGAEAWLRQEERAAGAVLLDDWLPDLTPREFAQQFVQCFPSVDVMSVQGEPMGTGSRCTRRNELLLVLRTIEASGDGQMLRDSSSRPCGHVDATAVVATDAEATEVTPLLVLPDVIGASPAMRELGRMIRLAAPHTATVLIEGETGTGKELIARAVHVLSTRAAKPFVTLNCAAIPEQLLEAELFGHTRGAFTGAVTSRVGRIEAAHGGTLFLDEIGEMPLALQAKMLRFLECGEIQRIGENETSRVDVRIVAATHQPLEEHAATGRFRLDLFHRLSVFPVTVPPLRDRLSDLPMLAQHMLAHHSKNMPQRKLNQEAKRRLLDHEWPGNVRELSHALQRAMILSSEDAEIGREHIVLRGGSRAA